MEKHSTRQKSIKKLTCVELAKARGEQRAEGYWWPGYRRLFPGGTETLAKTKGEDLGEAILGKGRRWAKT